MIKNLLNFASLWNVYSFSWEWIFFLSLKLCIIILLQYILPHKKVYTCLEDSSKVQVFGQQNEMTKIENSQNACL